MKELVKQIRDEKHTKVLDKHLDSLHLSLKLMEQSFRKPDMLRVTNGLRATARMSDALTRQVFVQAMAGRLKTLSELTGADKQNYLDDLEYILKRELEKDVLNAKISEIQNNAESGVVMREQIATELRTLADEIEAGEYPSLLQRTPSKEEVEAYQQKVIESLKA